MAHYRIVEWSQYQHYKDRDPPWIKLHRDTLTSRTWVSGDDRSRVLALACMLIAAGTDNKIPDDPGYIRRRAYLDYDPDFQPLVALGFIELVSDSKELPPKRKQKRAPREQNVPDASKPYSEGEESRAEERRDARARKTRVPDDWKPDDDLITYAKAQGCADPADTFERFRLHHASKGTLHENWRLAAQYWCRNEKNFTRATGNKPTGATGNALPPEEPWQQRVAGWRKSKFWKTLDWGPPPDSPGCIVPKQFLEGANGV